MKKVIILLAGLLLISADIKAQKFTFHESADLNSDGKAEQINLEPAQGTPGEFILTIAGDRYKDKLGDEIDGFRIIDIDRNDKYREVAVHTQGASDDDEYLIYWYDGQNIIKMSHLERWPTFLENGIVYVDNWEGFWKRRDKYVLDSNDRSLRLIPQYGYYVGVKVKVVNSFPIFRDKDLKDTVALLSKDSEIELLLCDPDNRDWNYYLYLVKSGSGLLGWAGFDEIQKNCTGFPYSD